MRTISRCIARVVKGVIGNKPSGRNQMDVILEKYAIFYATDPPRTPMPNIIHVSLTNPACVKQIRISKPWREIVILSNCLDLEENRVCERGSSKSPKRQVWGCYRSICVDKGMIYIIYSKACILSKLWVSYSRILKGCLSEVPNIGLSTRQRRRIQFDRFGKTPFCTQHPFDLNIRQYRISVRVV